MLGRVELCRAVRTHPSAVVSFNNYTVSGKKRTNSILGITSSNTSRFSNFFQCRNLLKICNNTAIKFPTIPQTRRYTTLWKTDVRKLVNQRDASHHFVAQNKNLGITNTFKHLNTILNILNIGRSVWWDSWHPCTCITGPCTLERCITSFRCTK